MQKYETLSKGGDEKKWSITADERSRSTSLDTKERLKAFISRQDYLHRHSNNTDEQMKICESKTGSVTLKKSFHDSSVGTEDFNEIDLKNSIQSID